MNAHVGRVRPAITSAVTLALVSLLIVGPSMARAATVATAWQAKLGSAGVNGTATITALDTGTGSLALKLARMKPATYLPVTLSKGTCSSVGSTLIKFPAIKTTSTGAAARTSSLSAGQVTLITNATRSGRIAIRVGSSTTGGVKCGLFAALYVPPPPPAVAATITVGFLPFDVAVTPSAVFVANGANNTLSKLDPVTNSALSSMKLGEPGAGIPVAVATGDGAVWVAVADYDANGGTLVAGSVLRVDPASGQVLATIPVGKGPFDIDASPGALWVANEADGTVSRIDTTSNAVIATINLSPGLFGIAFGEGAVWVTNEQTGSVSRIDPATNTVVATIATVGGPEGVVAGGGAVWVADYGSTGVSDGVVSRIDPVTNQVVRTIPVGTNPVKVALAGGSLWVALYGEPTIVQVSATANAVQTRTTVSGPSMGIAATDHTVWSVQQNVAGASATPPQPGTVTRINY